MYRTARPNPSQTIEEINGTEPRRRGVFRLDEDVIGRTINLPAGQRIIGFYPNPLRLTIDVCVEGNGLPACAPGTNPMIVNPDSYTERFSQWVTRGRDLEEMVRVIAEKLEGSVGDASAYGSDLMRVLDGTYDPRESA